MNEPAPRSWWQVDLVLRRASVTDEQAEAIRSEVTEAVARRDRPEDGRTFQGVRATDSYDISPPEGPVGVSYWLSADTAGTAVDDALGLVQEACRRVVGRDLPVWDVRLLPLDAVLSRGEVPPGGSMTALRSVRRGFLRRRLGRP